MSQVATFIKGRIVEIPVLAKINMVGPVVEGFRRLLGEPLDYQKSWCLDRDSMPPEETDEGLCHRQPPKDAKVFYHDRDDVEDKLTKQGVDFERYREWLHQCRELREACLKVAYDFVQQLDKERGTNFAEQMKSTQSPKSNVLRLLYYKPGHAVLAKDHYDRAFITVHVHDTEPGLVVGNEQTLVETDPGVVYLFPGFKAYYATQHDDDPILPLRHGARPVNQEDNTDGRVAIVFFAHIPVADEDALEEAVRTYRDEWSSAM